MAESVIAMVFSVRYSDKLIWRELDEGGSIYLHRIVVNPAFKGRKLFGVILDWAIDHVKRKRPALHSHGHVGRQPKHH